MSKARKIIELVRKKRCDIHYKKKIKRLLKCNTNLKMNFSKSNINNYYSKYGLKISTDWHKFYQSRNNINDVRYIPENLYYSIIESSLNNIELYKAYVDKSMLDVIIKDVKTPEVIIRNVNGRFFDNNFNIINKNDVIDKILTYDKIVFKATIDTGRGKNIKFVDFEEIDDKITCIKEVIDSFKKDYVVQTIIEQSDALSYINSSSVNTIRTISLYFKGEIHILSCVLRVGRKNRKVDNGGFSCGINTDGSLKNIAYDLNGNKYESSDLGIKFKDIKIPNYDEILNSCRRVHNRLSYFGIISCDFALDKQENPILIEYNLIGQEINFHQLNNGPLFGDLTDDLLKHILRK